MIDNTSTNETLRKYSWNPNWIQNYESSWSKIEKFKFANSASTWDFMQLFSKEDTRKKKNIIGNSHRDLYNAFGLDDDKIKNELQISIAQKSTENLRQFLSMFKNSLINKHSSDLNFALLRDYLCYCQQCLQNGYHCVLHQLKFVNKCPFHLSPLIRNCTVCEKPIPYNLLIKKTAGPYSCECGNELISWKPELFISEWKGHNSEIRDSLILEWLSMNDLQIKRLENTYFFDLVDIDQISDSMQFLLKVSNPQYQYDNICSTKSTLSIQHLESLNSKVYDSKSWRQVNNVYDLFSGYRDLETRAIEQEISKSAYKIIHSVEKNIKKSILKNHKTCIHRLVRVSKEDNKSLPPLCPYAFAFVFWKMSMHKIPNYYNVDHPTHRMERLNVLEFGSDEDEIFIRKILNVLLNRYPITHPNRFSHIKWSLNHVIARLAYGHFKNWLRTSVEYAPKQKIPRNIDFKYDSNDFFVMVFPENENDPIEFHSPKEKVDTNWMNSLECPYHSVKLRRKKKSEESYHPMLIAINNLKK